jgi:hypothetical protein
LSDNNAVPAIFYITTETVAFLPLDFFTKVPEGIELSPPTYESMPEPPTIPIERTETETECPDIAIEKIENLSPEASYLMEAQTIRSSNAKERYAWGRKVEKEIAPKILQKLGFTDIRPRNGRPVDIEAWRNRKHYLIDVKYLAKMPGIIKKLGSLAIPMREITVPRIRKRSK